MYVAVGRLSVLQKPSELVLVFSLSLTMLYREALVIVPSYLLS